MEQRKRKQIVGTLYNRWTVLEEVDSKRTVWRDREYVQRMFLCRCECWNEKIIWYSNLTRWASKSCWCLQREFMSKNNYAKTRPKFWEANPNWKWWVTKRNKILKNKERNNKEYRKWRKEIILRDKMCMKCNSVKRLEAHHIINFKEWFDFEVANWICFCNYCHHKFHKQFWFTNNSWTQLNEFMGYAGA